MDRKPQSHQGEACACQVWGLHPFLPPGLLHPFLPLPSSSPAMSLHSPHSLRCPLPWSHFLSSATPPNPLVPPNPPCCASNPKFSSLKPETDLFKPSHRSVWAQTIPGAFYVEHFHHCSSESFHLSVIFREEELKTTCGTSWREEETWSVLLTTLVQRKHPTCLRPACKAPHTCSISLCKLMLWVIPELGPQTHRGCGIPCLDSWGNSLFAPFFTQTRLQSQLRGHFFQKPFPDLYSFSLPTLVPP